MLCSKNRSLWPLGRYSLAPLLFASAPLGLATAAPLQGADECIDATPIFGPGPHPSDASAATSNGVDQPGCSFTFHNDIWFEWTAPATDSYIFEVLSPPSFIVAVLDGCGGTLITCRGGNLNNSPDPRVAFGGVQGARYTIRLAHAFSSPQVGEFTIRRAEDPVNGDCSAAIAIAGDGTFAFDHANPVTMSGTMPCGPIDNDVWFRWRAPKDGFVQFSTPNRRAAVAVYNTCGAPPIACDTTFQEAELIFPATAGTEYFIAIGTRTDTPPQTGTFSLETIRPSVDPASGHAYAWIPDALLYDDARRAADASVFRGVNGHLVTLSSAAEDTFVNTMISERRAALGSQLPFGPGSEGAWSGLFQDTTSPSYVEPDGGWVWVTGEPVTYTNWIGPNRPDNFTGHGLGDENFMSLRGAWEDWPERPLFYVVEWDLDPVGMPFCDPAVTNSSGTGTVLRANASTSPGTGVRLEATDGPPGEFGFCVVGVASDPVGIVLGSGLLCLSRQPGQPIGRYAGGAAFNSIGQFDSSGAFRNQSGTSTTGTGFEIPALLPFPGTPPITAGQTYYFQLWHRDGSMGSNLSNGLAVTF